MKNIVFLLLLTSCTPSIKIHEKYGVKPFNKYQYFGPILSFYKDSTCTWGKSYTKVDSGKWSLRENNKVLLNFSPPRVKIKYFNVDNKQNMLGCNLSINIDTRTFKNFKIEVYVNNSKAYSLTDNMTSLSNINFNDTVFLKIIPILETGTLFPYHPATVYSDFIQFQSNKNFYEIGIDYSEICYFGNFNPKSRNDTLKIHRKFIKSTGGGNYKYYPLKSKAH